MTLKHLDFDKMVATNHPRVFYYEKADKYGRGELNASKKIAEAFPNHKIIITMGPWRGYNLSYEINLTENIIHMDYYSPNPGTNYIPSIISEIRTKLNK